MTDNFIGNFFVFLCCQIVREHVLC